MNGSGYITEGGKLKAKNGHKYVVNSEPDGYFIPKFCALVLALLAIAAMTVIFVLCYFLFWNNSPCTASGLSKLANGNTSNVSYVSDNSAVATAGLFSSPASTNDHASTNGHVISEFIPIQADQSIDIQNKAFFLSEGWSPTLYKLVIEPNIDSGSNDGEIWIDVIPDPFSGSLPPIVLDINNITILSTNVIVQQSPAIETPPRSLNVDTFYGENNDTFVIDIKDTVPENRTLQVQLKFISQLTDTLQGFYRTNYETNSGERRWLASTQFSPIDARRAFPCFDRPDKKAQFQISVIRDEDKTMSLSNMPSTLTSYSRPGFIREDFAITPRMSTYLIAFIASTLVNTNVSRPEEHPNLPVINIWSREDVADMTGYTYTMTTKILPFLENYFGVRFNMPKIDMVAVPDFGFNAMENWGLITFRESAILVPEDEALRSSAEHTERVASVLAHELAHQWFGNLVTMRWWNDLWLKEGFATYMSYVSLDEIEPSWQRMDFLPTNELQRAMERDSDVSSHAISFPVSTPADIRRMFDPISYSKGASILRMMNGFLGDKAFKSALTAYLKKFAYSNAIQDDLWAIMTEYGHKHKTLPDDFDIKTIMDTWTVQAGFPVVTVTRNGTDVTISQHRYMLPETNLDDKSRWFIPITFETKAHRTQEGIPEHWLPKTDSITIKNLVDPNHWLYVNIKRAAYYRVNYDYSSWVILSRSYEDLPGIIQAQVLDDALHLARAELLTYDIPLTFLLKLNDGVLPWAAATPGLSYLSNMLNREPAYEHFRAMMKYILKPIYESMGFDESKEESHVQLMHRARIVGHSCFFGHDRCTNRAQIIFREWMANKYNNLISPNLKSIIYCTALREGSFQEWYFAYNRYLETTSASEKEIILSALGCTTKPWLLSKYLNMTISTTSGIRKQDGARAFTSVSKNPVGYEIAFDFLTSNIEEIAEYFGDGFSTISRMVDSLTTFMNKPYQLEQFEKFAQKTKELGLISVQGSIDLAIEQVRNNIFWRSRSYYQLQKFLEALTQQLHINIY